MIDIFLCKFLTNFLSKDQPARQNGDPRLGVVDPTTNTKNRTNIKKANKRKRSRPFPDCQRPMQSVQNSQMLL